MTSEEFETYTYQFPMGKVKQKTVKLEDIESIFVSIPYGKGKEDK